MDRSVIETYRWYDRQKRQKAREMKDAEHMDLVDAVLRSLATPITYKVYMLLIDHLRPIGIGTLRDMTKAELIALFKSIIDEYPPPEYVHDPDASFLCPCCGRVWAVSEIPPWETPLFYHEEHGGYTVCLSCHRGIYWGAVIVSGWRDEANALLAVNAGDPEIYEAWATQLD